MNEKVNEEKPKSSDLQRSSNIEKEEKNVSFQGSRVIAFPSGESCCPSGSLERAVTQETHSAHHVKREEEEGDKTGKNGYPTDKSAKDKLNKNDSTKEETITDSEPFSVERVQLLEQECMELQQKLREEVMKAVNKWRNESICPTLEYQNQKLEAFIRKLEKEDQAPLSSSLQPKSMISQLKLENINMRIELEELRKANLNDNIEKFRDDQIEVKELQKQVQKLTEEVSEKKIEHDKEIQQQLNEITKMRQSYEASLEALQKLRNENKKLRAMIQETRTAGCSEEEGPRLMISSIELSQKLESARMRIEIINLELDAKRKGSKKVPNTVRSLEELRDLWENHARLLEKLIHREAIARSLQDKVLLYVNNVKILRKENTQLGDQLVNVREQLARFRDNPMRPTALVQKNVNLLLRMEKIEEQIAQNTVGLDQQDKVIKEEEAKVRPLLTEVEVLRKENRHMGRRLQKASLVRRRSSAAASRADTIDEVSHEKDDEPEIPVQPGLSAFLLPGDFEDADDGPSASPSLHSSFAAPTSLTSVSATKVYVSALKMPTDPDIPSPTYSGSPDIIAEETEFP